MPLTNRVLDLLVALSLAAACGSPVDELPQTPAVPDSLLDAYREDAVHMSIRVIQDDFPPYGQPIRPPAALVDSIHSALARLAAATWLPARDTVVDVSPIHAFRTSPEVLVKYDTTAEWAIGWQRGERFTGEPALDTLIAGYDLDVRSSRIVKTDYVVLASPRPVNARALALAVEGSGLVKHAHENSRGGIQHDIAAERVPRGWKLDYFRRGRGDDCPFMGCPQWQQWTFLVPDAGPVEFLGSQGRS